MANTESSHAEAMLLELAHQVGRAWGVRDVATLERLIDDSYFHTDVRGRTLGRASMIPLGVVRVVLRKTVRITTASSSARYTILQSAAASRTQRASRARFDTLWP